MSYLLWCFLVNPLRQVKIADRNSNSTPSKPATVTSLAENTGNSTYLWDLAAHVGINKLQFLFELA